MAEVARSLAAELSGGYGSTMYEKVCLQVHVIATNLYHRKNKSSEL